MCQIQRLVRPFKPWVIPGPSWTAISKNASEIASELNAVAVVAKPSDNMYFGRPVGNLDAVSAGLANLASHGEMAVRSIHVSPIPLSPSAIRLIDILPTKVDLVTPTETVKIGSKGGKLLNHFGYRKVVMNLVPETLSDHAWIASALSYSTIPSTIDGFMFDPIGGGLAGGAAAVTSEGAIFRGSAIRDSEGLLVSADDSLHVSLAANGVADAKLIDKAKLTSDEEFVNHRFFVKLLDLLNRSSKPSS